MTSSCGAMFAPYRNDTCNAVDRARAQRIRNGVGLAIKVTARSWPARHDCPDILMLGEGCATSASALIRETLVYDKRDILNSAVGLGVMTEMPRCLSLRAVRCVSEYTCSLPPPRI